MRWSGRFSCFSSERSVNLDLTSEVAFWPLKNGLPAAYPALSDDVRCEIAVLGAGITGALVADRLTAGGRDVVLLDKREVVHGSTSASTGLLQYEVDTSLADLAKRLGEADAARAYRLSAAAIDRLDELTAELPDRCGFERRPSCYLASRPRDANSLREEFELRRKHGFEVEFLTEEQIADRFDFDAPAAIWSRNAAQVDAYRLAYQLLGRAVARGTRIFDRTEVVEMEPQGSGWKLISNAGHSVVADELVVATGYEAVKLLPRKLVRLHSTFALASQPLDDFAGWPDRCLLWETARPYFYARTTDDGRAVIGGEDEKFRSPVARDALIPRKTDRLLQRFRKLFPRIPIQAEYAWAGTFAETLDGLPYIGGLPELPHAWFALGYGGNGITFSMLAADLIAAAIDGRPGDELALFRFHRD